MADSIATPQPKAPRKSPKADGPEEASPANEATPAKGHFSRALDEAKAGVQQLGRDAQDRAQAYGKDAQARADDYREKLQSASGDWMNQAKARGEQAKGMAADVAREGKTKASEMIAALGQMVGDNAALVDEKVGSKYGDYARKAATTMQDTASKLDAKDLDELGEDAKEFVRKSPGLAIGMAAVAGFMLARMFKGSKD